MNLQARTGRMKVGNWMIRPIQCQALIYADDIVLIADTERKLQVAVDEWNETLEEKGMEINTTKSKVMQVAKTEDLVGQLNIHCKGIQMELTN